MDLVGDAPAPEDEDPHHDKRLIVPFGGLDQVWGVLMAARSDDPAEMRQIRRQRRLVAAQMILATVVGLVVVLVYPR